MDKDVKRSLWVYGLRLESKKNLEAKVSNIKMSYEKLQEYILVGGVGHIQIKNKYST